TRNKSRRLRARSHPRLTGYRSLFLGLTLALGIAKAVLSYRGHTVAATTLDWMYGIVVVSALYWVGLYEDECPGKLPWLFDTDVVEVFQATFSR
ncbi:hypothetical protein GGX14DRAFT_597332, partial [Mycena pura]